MKLTRTLVCFLISHPPGEIGHRYWDPTVTESIQMGVSDDDIRKFRVVNEPRMTVACGSLDCQRQALAPMLATLMQAMADFKMQFSMMTSAHPIGITPVPLESGRHTNPYLKSRSHSQK
jgi:hypothetical protein